MGTAPKVGGDNRLSTATKNIRGLGLNKNLSDGLRELDGRVGERGRDDQRVSGGVDDPNEDRGHEEAPAGREEPQKAEK